MSASKVVMKIVSISFSVLIMLLLVFAFYKAGEKSYEFGYRVFMEAPMTSLEEAEDKQIEITADMGAKDIGDILVKEELIRDSSLFAVQLKLSSYSNKIKEGTYTLSTAMTAKEMMQVMSAEVVEDTETQE